MPGQAEQAVQATPVDERPMDRPSGGRKRRFTVDALFEDTSPRSVGVSELASAKEIRLDRIVADPEQPRQTFDPERLDELSGSIRNEGVLQPIAVRYEAAEDIYVILHGERRWRAAQLAGLASIPAVVREVPPERRLLQQLMENVVREDLNAVDRAAALRSLKEQMGDVAWERVAEAVGIRRSRLFQLLGTEKLPVETQTAIRDGRLSEKQSRPLQGLASGAQEALTRMILDEGLGAREATRIARAVRDDDDFAGRSADELLPRLREMRQAAEARPAPRQPIKPADSHLNPLSQALGAAIDEHDLATALAEAPDPSIDLIDLQIRALALSLTRLDELHLSDSDRRRLDTRLKALRALLKSE